MALVAIFALLSVASVAFIYLLQVNSWHASEMGLLRFEGVRPMSDVVWS